MQFWTPAAEGAGFEFTPILKPLEPFRDQLLVISGLNGVVSTGAHAGASTRFLTAVAAKTRRFGAGRRRVDGSVRRQGTRAAHAARLARAGARGTRLRGIVRRRLQLRLHEHDRVAQRRRRRCRWKTTRAWCSSGCSAKAGRPTRGARGTARADRSILDSVIDKTTSLQQRLGAHDRSKLSDYLEAIRDVERRIQKAEDAEREERGLPVVAQPAGVPASFDEHAKLMFDLQVLAYQSDLTRVITFMMGREISGRTYPEIGVHDAHHPISHHQNDQEKIATLAKINTFHTTLFCVLPGEAAGDAGRRRLAARSHAAPLRLRHVRQQRALAENLPILLVGGVPGRCRAGAHEKHPNGLLANLHLSILDKLGVPIDKIGNSVAPIAL